MKTVLLASLGLGFLVIACGSSAPSDFESSEQDLTCHSAGQACGWGHAACCAGLTCNVIDSTHSTCGASSGTTGTTGGGNSPSPAASPKLDCGFDAIQGTFNVQLHRFAAAAQVGLAGLKQATFTGTACRSSGLINPEHPELNEGPQIAGDVTLDFGNHIETWSYAHTSYTAEYHYVPEGGGSTVEHVPGPLTIHPKNDYDRFFLFDVDREGSSIELWNGFPGMGDDLTLSPAH